MHLDSMRFSYSKKAHSVRENDYLKKIHRETMTRVYRSLINELQSKRRFATFGFFSSIFSVLARFAFGCLLILTSES